MAVITRHIEACPSCARHVAEQHRVKSLLYQISDIDPDPLLWTDVITTLRENYKPIRILSLAKHPAWANKPSSLLRRSRFIFSAAAVLVFTIASIIYYMLDMQTTPIAQNITDNDDMSFYLKEHALHSDESVFSNGAFGAVMVNNAKKK